MSISSIYIKLYIRGESSKLNKYWGTKNHKTPTYRGNNNKYINISVFEIKLLVRAVPENFYCEEIVEKRVEGYISHRGGWFNKGVAKISSLVTQKRES